MLIYCAEWRSCYQSKLARLSVMLRQIPLEKSDCVPASNWTDYKCDRNIELQCIESPQAQTIITKRLHITKVDCRESE